MGQSRNYCFLVPGDKLCGPVTILATLFSPRSTLHSLNTSCKTLFEGKYLLCSVCFSVFIFLFGLFVFF